MNKEQILAIIQGGHTTDGDLADALLAELAKGAKHIRTAFLNKDGGVTLLMIHQHIQNLRSISTPAHPHSLTWLLRSKLRMSPDILLATMLVLRSKKNDHRAKDS